jgi:hypothetical protein
MIFPPSQTSVALRSTDDELARRVEIKMRCYFVEERQGSRTIFQIDASHCLLMTFFQDGCIHIRHAWSCHIWPCVASDFLAPRGLQRLRMQGEMTTVWIYVA